MSAATRSAARGDLVIKNKTPYGIMIATSYTGTSLTVRLISTRRARGEQTGDQTKEPQEPQEPKEPKEPKESCTRVSTEGTRTYVDAHKDVDHVYAMYQNQDGVKCT